MSTLEETVAEVRRSPPHEVGGLFTRLAASASGRALAWNVLQETCERAASGQSIQRGASFFEREIRRLGPVVAWREARVTEQRSLAPGAAVQLRVCASPAEADALVATELGAATCEWGIRPGPDELGDLRAHLAAVLGPVLASGVPCDPAALAKALWYSAANGHLETTRLLLEHGADPNGYVQYKKTARAIAASRKSTALAAQLAKAGGELRAPK
jgi:hypothetical protein